MADSLVRYYGGIAVDVQEIVIPPEDIQKRVADLGRQISRDYLGRNPVLVGVLKGVLFFMADLIRHLSIPAEMDFISVQSYTPETRQQGFVRIAKDLDTPVTGRHVIFVEDLIDTGATMSYLLDNLRARRPASIETCVLFDKPHNRLTEIPIRYKGFDLPDKFVVGYGLDYREKYRNLPFIGLLKPGVISGVPEHRP
jgi:hypoxanthine phosphoribosyltransferase